MIIVIVLFSIGCGEMEGELRRGEMGGERLDSVFKCADRVQVLRLGQDGWLTCCSNQKMKLQVIEGPGAQRSLMVTCTSSEIDNQVSPSSSMETH